MAAPSTGGEAVGPTPSERLRDRRRRELREELSALAVRMFLEHGYDAVRVADVAEAVGVTTKTVFNHFPTKESLIEDRWEAMTAGVEHLARDARTPLLAIAEQVLQEELELLLAPSRAPMLSSHLEDLSRFRELVESTPALRSHEADAMERLMDVIVGVLAERAGVEASSRDDPTAVVRAAAIVGLWRVFYRSLRRSLLTHATDPAAVATIREDVLRDLRAACRALHDGV